MFVKTPFLILTLSIIVFACKKDDDEIPNRVIFKVTVSQGTTGSDHWIVLRDNETGELIESRQVIPDQVETFESDKDIPSGKLTVTLFSSGVKLTVGNYLQVFSGVDVGAEWLPMDVARNYNDPNAQPTEGKYFLVINNVPSLYAFAASDQHGWLNIGPPAEYVDQTLSTEVLLRTGVKQLISIDTKDGKPEYAFVENIQADGTITLDYNTDFKEFDKYIDVEVPTDPIGIELEGYGTNTKYFYSYDLYNNFSHSFQSGVNKPEIKLGLLDELSNYRIVLRTKAFGYQVLGPAPSEIKLPSTTGFRINGTAAGNYNVIAVADYGYSLVTYYYSEGIPEAVIQVDHYAPKNGITHFEPLTDEIVSKYSLKMDKLTFLQAYVTLGQTYPDLLNNYFNADYDTSQPYEITTVTLSVDN